MECSIRTMSRDEVAMTIEWAADEGWNPGLHDAACFHAADPDGFLVAECDGKAVGCISAVSYAGRFGFIGLYIVRPGWRGRGIGLRLWTAGMQRLSGQVVGLDGVPAQQDNYRKSGFVLAWKTSASPARPVPQCSTRTRPSCHSPTWTSPHCAPTTVASSRPRAMPSCTAGRRCQTPPAWLGSRMESSRDGV
ncbi:GNAT family N-acetyltransferase [Variovorax saccharolyticus]|uniref:GNAT family N-acetyltransferase n=1 Tax=Variovorax saccharolyticus TaxID=3053516 RepID=UPI002578D685|nr:GNAT family N-acetyltransferase [Variovorax sp. J22R187]MDM0022149.1 GNAT family N-acetyltransferase [Variovorax sp. J22R187]